jgi:hypothetical protein
VIESIKPLEWKAATALEPEDNELWSWDLKVSVEQLARGSPIIGVAVSALVFFTFGYYRMTVL